MLLIIGALQLAWLSLCLLSMMQILPELLDNGRKAYERPPLQSHHSCFMLSQFVTPNFIRLLVIS